MVWIIFNNPFVWSFYLEKYKKNEESGWIHFADLMNGYIESLDVEI